MNIKRINITLIISGLVLFLVALILLLSENAHILDAPIRFAFYNARGEAINPAVSLFTHAGDWEFLITLCIVLTALPKTRWDFGVPASAGLVCVAVFNKFLKHIFDRIRPDDILHLVTEGGYSFPSGHSICSMFVYGFLAFALLRFIYGKNAKNSVSVKILTAILIAMPFLIGASRVFVGVHFPTDVIAGWGLGLTAIGAFTILLDMLGKCPWYQVLRQVTIKDVLYKK